MQRSKMRKFDAVAKASGLGRPEHRPVMEEALAACHNKTTRAKLRSRFQRGA